jgi:post-segregation antitoxin (ccd killing protein)
MLQPGMPQGSPRPRDSHRVYTMRMSRVNVYLPDDLADEAKKAGLNISSLTQEAIRSSLARQDLALWQQRVAELDSPGVSHSKVADAVSSAKDEFEGA